MSELSSLTVVLGAASSLAMAATAVVACWFLSGRRWPAGARRALLAWAPLVVLWGVGGWVTVRRFTGGLASTTNLSNAFPWGIWVCFDVLCGVATAAGGFLTAGSVYVFGWKRLYPVLRPAVLTAFLGYLLVSGGLIFDLGRPYNIWHPLVYWQHRSVMFEVAWCVTLYSTVLALEFLPILLEWLGWRRALAIVKPVTIPVVIAGVVLSTLHQSSLGAVFLIVPNKLSPLWYTPALPLFFLMSAGAVGFAMIVFESTLTARIFGRHAEVPIYESALRVFGVLCAALLVFRFVDLSIRGAWVEAFRHPFLGLSFAMESLLFALPVAVLARPSWARSHAPIFLASLSVILAVVLNRLNVGWFGLVPASGVLYVPSWQEVVVSLLLLSFGVVAFGLAARYLPLFEDPHREEAPVPAAGDGDSSPLDRPGHRPLPPVPANGGEPPAQRSAAPGTSAPITSR